ncbi:unnamed protein product, partial [marine sediment metagenome]
VERILSDRIYRIYTIYHVDRFKASCGCPMEEKISE